MSPSLRQGVHGSPDSLLEYCGASIRVTAAAAVITPVASALVTVPVVYWVNRNARGSLLAASALTVVTGLALMVATGHGLVEIFQ